MTETRIHGADQLPGPHIGHIQLSGCLIDRSGFRYRLEEIRLAGANCDFPSAENTKTRAQCLFYHCANYGSSFSMYATATAEALFVVCILPHHLRGSAFVASIIGRHLHTIATSAHAAPAAGMIFRLIIKIQHAFRIFAAGNET